MNSSLQLDMDLLVIKRNEDPSVSLGLEQVLERGSGSRACWLWLCACVMKSPHIPLTEGGVQRLRGNREQAACSYSQSKGLQWGNRQPGQRMGGDAPAFPGPDWHCSACSPHATLIPYCEKDPQSHILQAGSMKSQSCLRDPGMHAPCFLKPSSSPGIHFSGKLYPHP